MRVEHMALKSPAQLADDDARWPSARRHTKAPNARASPKRARPLAPDLAPSADSGLGDGWAPEPEPSADGCTRCVHSPLLYAHGSSPQCVWVFSALPTVRELRRMSCYVAIRTRRRARRGFYHVPETPRLLSSAKQLARVAD